MTEEQGHAGPEPYDAIVIGAGICGIIFLKYAREKGLRCLALEKQGDVGGVWNRLPAWQDIQNRKADFSIDGVPLHGVTQPAIQDYAREWVRRFGLDRFIKLGCEVASVAWSDGVWQVRTDRGEFCAEYVIVASGAQNEPWIPDVDRSESDILEIHSSQLRRPEDLADKRVTVVGGGTSSWDLLDLATANGARAVHWVHRSIKWFLPTKGTKQTAWPNLRELSLVQSVLPSPEGVTAFLRWMLRVRFKWLRLTALEPAESFDIQKHQLIPGRRFMIRNLGSIARHRGEVRRMRNREVTLDNGERFETDVVLWGTGYRMSLEYLGLPEYSRIDKASELLPRLGSLVRSIDYPNLFFIGMTLVESTSSTPFLAAVEARSIVSHILGDCEIPEKSTPRQIAYWRLFEHFARFDRANYPRFRWRIKLFALALWYAVLRGRGVRV
jgi:hypothetical protein